MRQGVWAKSILLVWALAGCLAGVGMDALLQGDQCDEQQYKDSAKDNTPVQDEGNGVFFDDEENTVQSVPQQEDSETEALTYPSEIFGQVPKVDRNDRTVTYFEFSLDLIELLEPEIEQKKLNETALFSKFVLKALFCGVEITELNINAPIPKDHAALAIYLAAEVLNAPGTKIKSTILGKYAVDAEGCSAQEKKAMVYLYEQGIVNTQGTAGKRFFPDEALTEAEYETWKNGMKTLFYER